MSPVSCSRIHVRHSNRMAIELKRYDPGSSNADPIRGGGISDNRKGGWYGYRASKAAMNMVLQTAAIELQRRNPHLRVVALQPGTVRSRLSKPFERGVEHLLEPDESVAGLTARQSVKSHPP
jgi:NAD(P)-dependent dehydrogenase (short-subunit alcohol dehydrogenase family)